MDKMFITR